MRVERIRIGAFGRLRGLDTGDTPLPPIVVVYGPNEAGKSTFFHFLTTLLYGFHPSSREKHPYAPWEGGGAEGDALLRMDGGERWEVHRRLLSSPSGSLVRGGTEEELRNQMLPCVGHVPRAVFRQVFALTLAELAGLEGESWAAVQDRLLGAMGASDLRPARLVAAELEREAAELWRPNRRGRQRARDLKQEIIELRRRREAALDQDVRLRDVSSALEAGRLELQALRQERAECRALLERERARVPLRGQIRRLQALESEVGDVRELEGLPADPRSHVGSMEARLREIDEALARKNQESRDPRGRIEAYGRPEEQLLRRGDAVRALVARALALESEGVRRGQLGQELRDLERRSETLAGELLGGPWDAAAVRSVSVPELRDAVRAYQGAREERALAAESSRRQSELALPVPAWPAVLLLAVAAVALPAAIAFGGPAAVALAGIPALAGAYLLFLRGAKRRARATLEAAHMHSDVSHSATEERTRAAVHSLLLGLPLRDGLLARPDLEMVAQIERLQELLRDRVDRARALEALEARARDFAASVDELSRELRLELSPDPAASAHMLAARLRDTESKREAAGAARRELERLVRDRNRLEEEQARLRSERDVLRARLEKLGGGNVSKGLQRAHARIEARALARRLGDELARAHPDLALIRERLAEAPAAGEEQSLAAQTAREEALTDRIEALARRTEGLAHEAERLREAETADAVEGEILLLEEELGEARRERDRRWLLARLLREAERRFREEHQPDIVRHAGAHLETITGGRYRRILVGDGEEGSFFLYGPGYTAPVRVAEPISTGTREQVYLALRLAIVDHLDRDGERLPLFMDEAFVNWDPERFERGMDVLESVAERRQLFLFSCHPEVVDRLGARGARVLHLARAS